MRHGAAHAAVLTSLFLGLVVQGCGSPPPREITLDMTSFRFTPTRVEVSRGERIAWVLQNRSDIDHEFGSDQALVEEVVVPPHTTRTIGWTAPRDAGTYSFHCAMKGHDGMVMMVDVR